MLYVTYAQHTKKRDEKLANPSKAKVLAGFFKTGKGEYGEGDLFLGLTVPQSRTIAKKFASLTFGSIRELLKSPYHEERLVALLMLAHNYQLGNEEEKERIYSFYLKNTKCINNWDLVDLSAEKIAGAFLLDKRKDILYKLARSENVWERRISIVCTYYFIKNRQFEDTMKISELLLDDKHDLIHKAVGWMLREVGKRNLQAEEEFLKKHCKRMPRTMLRYAIERFPENKRKFYIGK